MSQEERNSGGTKTISKPETKIKKPSMYKVILLNDDYTPMDFVVHVLKKFFQKSDPEADAIMLQVHHDGAGIAGIYTREMAETKTVLVNTYAKENQHPLKCTMEKE